MPAPQTIKARGELIEPTEAVSLTIQYRDPSGDVINADTYPQISIVSPSGLVILTPTSAGVSQIGIGKYQYTFSVPINGPYGVFNDIWVGFVNGYRIEQEFSFVVSHTDLPAINSDGYISLGDDPGFNYSQTALFNINKCIKMVKARLNSSGKAKSIDANGNVMYVDCDIFSIDMLATFVAMSLNKFNSIPYFTNFTFENSDFFAQFAETIAEGAWIFALASQALIERGREFTLTDNGINFNPPTVSELLNSSAVSELTHWFDYVKMIKASMRPGPKAIGTFNPLNASNSNIPAIKRMSLLRARRIF